MPAKTSCELEVIFCDADKKPKRFAIVSVGETLRLIPGDMLEHASWSGGSLICLLLPPMMLTVICMLSVGDGGVEVNVASISIEVTLNEIIASR